ncbi:MAG: type II secretion system F family protein [Lachnospiraceae bacterium]|nr:type II secretion system F family protein [Lachnospiraceae bacterium]
MASYGYVAIDAMGKEIKGSVEADNPNVVIDKLSAQNLTVIDVSEQSILNKDIQIDIGGKPKARDFSVFCRQFVSMTQAGVTILDALNMLGDQTENVKLAKAIKGTQISVEKGETLSDSMEEQKKIFPPLLIHMVRAGESSGSLDIAFERMAIQFEKDAKLQATIKKAMIYPIIVMLVAIGVVIVMLTFVIPNYAEMFEDMDMELPGITVAVMNMSDFVIGYWYILIAVVIAAVVAFRMFYASPQGRHIVDNILLRNKLTGPLSQKSASARFARTLSTMLAAGISMPDALEITAGTLTNVIMRDAVMDAREDIVQGTSLSLPIERSRKFPPMVHHMIRIGEESGDVEGLLTKLADYYEEEVEMATESMMAVMEPLIILLLAGIVGTLIGAVMAPMLAMYQGLDNL